MNNFWKGLMATAIPIFLLGVISTVGSAISANSNFGIAWIIGVILLGPALITGIVLVATGRRHAGAGVFVGIGIGVVTLGVTCFANVAVLATP